MGEERRRQAGEDFEGAWEEGVGWYCYPTRQFKTITVQCLWMWPLALPDATLGALLPEVLKRGTRRWPSTQALASRLEELYGAHFRADVGKVADHQVLSFQVEVVDGQFLPGRPDMFAHAVELLQEVLNRPRLEGGEETGRFPVAVVEQEKALLRRRIQALINDKAQYANQRLMELVADGRPFGFRKYGRLEDVEWADADRLTAFYRRVRAQAPMLVLAVGNVEPTAVEAAARRLAAGGRRSDLPRVQAYQPRGAGRLVVEEEDVSQGKVAMAYATRRILPDPDFPALLMYAGILGGFPHSKLFMQVRERASLAYYAFARADANLGLMLIGAGIEPEHFSRVRDIIAAQLDAMREGDITDQEMAFTLRALINELRSEADVPAQLIGRQVERLLAGGGTVGARLEAALRRVEREDIRRVAADVVWDTTFFLTRPGRRPSIAGAEVVGTMETEVTE